MFDKFIILLNQYLYVIYNFIIKFYHRPLDENIFSNKCTKSIGCRYHRKWDNKFIRYLYYQ